MIHFYHRQTSKAKRCPVTPISYSYSVLLLESQNRYKPEIPTRRCRQGRSGSGSGSYAASASFICKQSGQNILLLFFFALAQKIPYACEQYDFFLWYRRTGPDMVNGPTGFNAAVGYLLAAHSGRCCQYSMLQDLSYSLQINMKRSEIHEQNNFVVYQYFLRRKRLGSPAALPSCYLLFKLYGQTTRKKKKTVV